MKNKIFKIKLIILLLFFLNIKNNNDFFLYDKQNYYNPKCFKQYEGDDLIYPVDNYNYIRYEINNQDYLDAKKADDFANNMNYFSNNWNNKGIDVFDQEGYLNVNAFEQYEKYDTIYPKYKYFKNDNDSDQAYYFQKFINSKKGNVFDLELARRRERARIYIMLSTFPLFVFCFLKIN